MLSDRVDCSDMEVTPEESSTHHSGRSHRRRRKHRKKTKWRVWLLRLVVLALIAVAAVLGYWIASHLNQRPPADVGAKPMRNLHGRLA
jgi:predicted anti-sigma-YlaC factor YlaD